MKPSFRPPPLRLLGLKLFVFFCVVALVLLALVRMWP